jgi:hypothetical protein
MKLNTEFYQLPLRFEVARLQQELSLLAENDWTSQAAEAAGNVSIILVSVGGTLNHDFAISGPVAPTAFLERCPYLKQVLKTLASPISRCRLVRLKANSAASPPKDGNYYHWFRRMPVYLPIVTHPAVKFFCHDKSTQMAAGEAWVVDTTQRHWLVNGSSQDCIHLVIETKGSTMFQEMLESATTRHSPEKNTIPEIPYVSTAELQVPLEPYNFEVLTPQEMSQLTADLRSEIEQFQLPDNDLLMLVQQIEEFNRQWAKTFARFGHHRVGELSYQDLICQFNKRVVATLSKWLWSSTGKGKKAITVIGSMLAVNRNRLPKRFSRLLLAAKRKKPLVMGQFKADFQVPEFERPLFIVSTPRAGSTLLFETLSQFPEVWTIARESHEAIEGLPELHPATHQFSSNRLTETDASPHISLTLRQRFTRLLQEREGQGYLELPVAQRPPKVRFVEKTPKNALRIPFLQAVFPDALFIYLYREPKENISSLMEGWRSRRFISYRSLPSWPYLEWCFFLPPGWSSLRESSLVEIAAYQWKSANSQILEDLRALPRSRWCLVRYTDLIRDPKKVFQELSDFGGLSWDAQIEQKVSQSLPVSRMTISTPVTDKWRKNEQELATVLPDLEPLISLVEKLGK